MQWSLEKRPHTLAGLYGNPALKTYLTACAKQKSFPESMCFQGQYGTGKTSAALIAAQMMVCNNPDENGNPCCECAACKDIINNSFHRDVVMYDGGQMKKDDIIDTISRDISLPTRYDKCKVIIMEEVQELSTKAKNAMLKILEMKKPHVHFIFTTMENLGRNGFTSRSVQFNFQQAQIKDLMMYMAQLLQVEGLWDEAKLPKEFLYDGLANIAQNSNGSYRDAVQILQKCLMAETYTKEAMALNFNILDTETYVDILYGILNGTPDEKMLNTLITNDYTASFRMSYALIASAEQFRTFGFTTGSSYTEAAAKKLSSHPNFDIILNGFKNVSLANKNGYLEKSDYILEVCDMVRKCKAAKSTSAPVAVRRITG